MIINRCDIDPEGDQIFIEKKEQIEKIILFPSLKHGLNNRSDSCCDFCERIVFI
jgi:hypothetical protein